jgi:hypothetical protein
MIELVRLRNVPVQGGGIELSQKINPPQSGVDAVGNRDVNDAIFAGQRNGRLGALFGQGKQPRPLPATHDDRKHIARVWRLPSGL